MSPFFISFNYFISLEISIQTMLEEGCGEQEQGLTVCVYLYLFSPKMSRVGIIGNYSGPRVW